MNNFMMYSYVHHDKHAKESVCHDILPQNVSAMYMAWQLLCFLDFFSPLNRSRTTCASSWQYEGS